MKIHSGMHFELLQRLHCDKSSSQITIPSHQYSDLFDFVTLLILSENYCRHLKFSSLYIIAIINLIVSKGEVLFLMLRE